jgi:hypothetical protein
VKVLRQFSALWLIVFMILGALQYWKYDRELLGWGLGAVALVVGVTGLLRPASVRWLFVGWMMLAFPIGWLVSQVVLVVIFYAIITPVALMLRLRGRDALCRKPAPRQTSFWTPKSTPQDMRSYFRQY